MPANVNSPLDLDEDEYEDFLDQVNQVLMFAQRHGITDAATAVDAHVDSIRQQYKPPTIQ